MTISAPLSTVRKRAEQARRAVVARDDAIHRCRELHYPLRAIAEAAGLSHTAIAKIVQRASPDHRHPQEQQHEHHAADQRHGKDEP